MLKKVFLAAGVLILFFGLKSRAAECTDCHNASVDEKWQMVQLTEGSAHAVLSCTDCHPMEVDATHPPAPPAIACGSCHADQQDNITRSTHGKNLAAHLRAKNAKSDDKAVCMSCHGDNVHHLLRQDDPRSPVNRVNVFKTCLTCHNNVQPIAVDIYTASIHGTAASGGNLRSAVCSDCHGSHYIEGMDINDSTVYFSTIPETCGKCHPKEMSEYHESKHWKMVQNGYREAPVCTNCHGEHGIRSQRDPQSPAWVGNVTQTCAGCHESQMINAKFMLPDEMVKSFLDSYHGLSGRLGDVRVANCSSCHGNHSILPSSDPKSMVHPANLSKTCGACHRGAERRFINEPIHKSEKSDGHLIVVIVRNIYIALILLTVGGMLAHNLTDLYYKSTQGLPYHKIESLHPRFSVNERLQHMVLALSFITLAYTGFSLRFQDSFFAYPFQLSASGGVLRAYIHRAAATVMVLISFYHMFYLAFTARGRQQFMLMMPTFKDAFDAVKVMLRYAGRNRDEHLELPHYAYVEKAEYYALVWGSIIMTVTGIALMLTDQIIAMGAPLWVIDLSQTIHFYEAVLAVSAIAVWHGYWVVFDPEYYPLNLTFLFGNPRRTGTPHAEPVSTPEPGPEAQAEGEGKSPA